VNPPRPQWYREKLVAVEVMHIRWDGDFEPVSEWVRDNGGVMLPGQKSEGPAFGWLSTPEGVVEVHIGYSVIKQPESSFVAYPRDEFSLLYDPIE
jgi:hypothetical protein